MRRAALVLAAAVFLTGCATEIDNHRAERHIIKLLLDGGVIHVRSVHCPPGVIAKKGRTFKCKVTAKDGSSEDVEVDIANAKGDVRFIEPDALDPASIEPAIVRAITKQTGFSDVTASCPEIIRSGSGETARCDVSGGGRSNKVTILQTDDDGNFRIIGLLQ